METAGRLWGLSRCGRAEPGTLSPMPDTGKAWQPAHARAVSASLCLCHCVCLSLSLSHLFLSLLMSLLVSVSLSLSLSLTVSLSLSLFLLSLCLCLSLPVSLCLSLLLLTFHSLGGRLSAFPACGGAASCVRVSPRRKEGDVATEPDSRGEPEAEASGWQPVSPCLSLSPLGFLGTHTHTPPRPRPLPRGPDPAPPPVRAAWAAVSVSLASRSLRGWVSRNPLASSVCEGSVRGPLHPEASRRFLSPWFCA